MEKLTPAQRELIYALYGLRQSVIEIARSEGVTEAAIRNRRTKILNRLKKTFFADALKNGKGGSVFRLVVEGGRNASSTTRMGGMMMRHQIRINVANRSGQTRQIVQGRTLRLPRRLMRFLFGDFCEVLVLTPGRTVCGVEIHEVRPESEVS